MERRFRRVASARERRRRLPVFGPSRPPGDRRLAPPGVAPARFGRYAWSRVTQRLRGAFRAAARTSFRSRLIPGDRRGVRYAARASSATAQGAPSPGTATPADQRIPFTISWRNPARDQAEWASRPVKQNDRPPAGRSYAQQTTSARPPAADPRRFLPDHTSAVTPFIASAKRISFSQPSRIDHGPTPRVAGWDGNSRCCVLQWPRPDLPWMCAPPSQVVARAANSGG